jgi:hypothetical protein
MVNKPKGHRRERRHDHRRIAEAIRRWAVLVLALLGYFGS